MSNTQKQFLVSFPPEVYKHLELYKWLMQTSRVGAVRAICEKHFQIFWDWLENYYQEQMMLDSIKE
jgi:hypothetical protein